MTKEHSTVSTSAMAKWSAALSRRRIRARRLQLLRQNARESVRVAGPARGHVVAVIHEECRPRVGRRVAHPPRRFEPPVRRSADDVTEIRRILKGTSDF